MTTPVMNLAARKVGRAGPPQRMLLFDDQLKVVAPRRLSSVTVASVSYSSLSSVDLLKGFFSGGLVLRRRRGKPLVIQVMIPKEASQARAFLVGKLTRRA